MKFIEYILLLLLVLTGTSCFITGIACLYFPIYMIIEFEAYEMLFTYILMIPASIVAFFYSYMCFKPNLI